MGVKDELDDAYERLFEQREPVAIEFIDMFYNENEGVLLDYEDGLLGIHADESKNAVAFTIFVVNDERTRGIVDESITVPADERLADDIKSIVDSATKSVYEKVMLSLRRSSETEDDSSSDDDDEPLGYIG